MNSSADETNLFDTYATGDLVVLSGVNAGDPVGPASESFEGDVYLLREGAVAQEMAHHGAGNFDGGLVAESRLTLMGENGARAEVVMLADAETRDVPRFLPLSPLVPGVEYTLIATDAAPGAISHGDYCAPSFARGTMIRMADGSARAIETLEEGDRVLTRDSGPRPVRRITGRTARAHGHLAPVVITKGALKNTDDLIVSQSHRMLIADWRAEVMLGSHEVLLRARDLVNGDTIFLREGGMVEYFDIMLDRPEIIYAEDIPSQSRGAAPDTIIRDAPAGNVAPFPSFESYEQVPAVAGRMSLKSCEAEALLKQVGFR